MIANKCTIKTIGLCLVALVIAHLVAGCAAPKPVKVFHFQEVIGSDFSASLVRRTNNFTIGNGGGTNVHGCVWVWTNTINGYFRIERKDRLEDAQWQVATNTLWCHYLETNKQSGYFRGWYVHNLYGMIPIRTGN